MSGLQPNFWKLAKEIIDISGALAWCPADAPFVHLTGGNVDTWYDIAQRRTLTDQGVAGNRPPWDGSNPMSPFVNFDGTRVLYGMNGVLNGLSGCTVILTAQLATPAGTSVLCGYEVSTGVRFEVYTPAANTILHTFAQSGAGANTDWGMTGNADTANVDVFVFRVNFPDTVTAAKPVRVNGVDQAGAYGSAAAANTTFPVNSFSLGAYLGNAANFPAKFKARDVLIAPYLDNTKADYLYQCFKTLRGTA